jgi:TonB family protein
MNRLQKKCVVASAGIHLLLALILFVGPGFISSQSKPDDQPVLNFVPAKTVDELMAPGGGNPNAKPPPAAAPVQPQPQDVAPPPQPQPQPQPEKIREPEPQKLSKPIKPQEESLEPAKEPPPKKVEISTTMVTRKRETSEDKKAREDAQARADAKALADARRRLARQIGQTADHIGSELSSGTTVEMQGPGGGGLPYANWKQALKSAYANAWLLPDGAVDDEATTVASVTIARDGTVVSARITQRSRDAVVDRSVQATLDRVRHAPPLPDDSKEDQRTVTINFNVKAKRSLG